MKRGDVVRTTGEYAALPVGTTLVCIDGGVRTIPNHSHNVDDDWFPALVRVVGPVEPEWLEAAAQASSLAAGAIPSDWHTRAPLGQEFYRGIARAAVAAADKARGIVNSREEFDALPVGTVCLDSTGARYQRGGIGYPDSWPVVIMPPVAPR